MDLAIKSAWSPGLSSTLANWTLSSTMFPSLTSQHDLYSSLMPPTTSSLEQSRLWMRRLSIAGHHHPPRTSICQYQMSWFWCPICCVVYWHLHHHGESSGPLKEWNQKGHHLCPLSQCQSCFNVSDGYGSWDNLIKIVNNAPFTTNCLGFLGKVIMTTLALLQDSWP